MSISSGKICLQDSAAGPLAGVERPSPLVAGAGVEFRRMTPSDLDEIMTIERDSFAYPWSLRFFLQELRVPCARSLLATVGSKAVGYIIYWVLAGEVDIHNLAVHPSYRRRGIGKHLLQAVVEEAKGNGSGRVTLEVRKSNEPAQRLYQALGFVERGVRKGYYSDDGEDALAMVLEIGR